MMKKGEQLFGLNFIITNMQINNSYLGYI